MNTDTNTTVENSAEPEVTQTLEDIAKGIPLEEQIKNFTAAPQPVLQTPYIQPQQPVIPDPISDQEGYRRWANDQMLASRAMQSSLQELSGKVRTYEQQQQQQRLDAEVDSVVSKVNSNLKLDPDLVEAALNVRYKKDPAFKHIWDNRQRFPGALDNALKVVTNDLKAKYAVRQDPQIAENIRAAKNSMQSGATRSSNSGSEVPTDPREFAAYWRRLVNGG
jgi:hypothetical protein